MAGHRPIRTAAIAILTALGGSLIVFALIQLISSPPAWVSNTAIELTAAEGVAATAGNALDPGWLQSASDEVNTYYANFLGTMHDTMANEATALGNVYSDWTSDFGTDLNTAVQNLDALGQDYGHWSEGLFQSVVGLETEMPGTVAADNTSLCDVFTLIGMDMDKWANTMGLGASDLFQNMVTEFSTVDQQVMDGMNSLFTAL